MMKGTKISAIRAIKAIINKIGVPANSTIFFLSHSHNIYSHHLSIVSPIL